MDRIEQRKIRAEISHLEDLHCAGCQKVKEWKKELGSFKGSQLCHKQCKIGKEIKALGDLIVYGRRTLKARDLTKEEYLGHKAAGWTDQQICKKYKIGSQLLLDRKRHWKLIQHKTPSKEKYLQLKEEGLPDEFAAEIMETSLPTLRRYIKRWGLELDKVNYIKETQKGERITPELYKRDIQIYGTDKALSREWGISLPAFERRKKEWRESGWI